MSQEERQKRRATAGPSQAFGETPQEALAALMPHLPRDGYPPIVIWPYNQGVSALTDAQQSDMVADQGA